MNKETKEKLISVVLFGGGGYILYKFLKKKKVSANTGVVPPNINIDLIDLEINHPDTPTPVLTPPVSYLPPPVKNDDPLPFSGLPFAFTNDYFNS